jgi:hypothetical protein
MQAPAASRDRPRSGRRPAPQRLPQPFATLTGQHAERFDDGERELALTNVFSPLLQVTLEPAQVQHVVHDLERQADGFEERPELLDLPLISTAEDRTHASQHSGRNGRLQPMQREHTGLELVDASRSSGARSPEPCARQVDGLSRVTGAHGVEIQAVDAELLFRG